MSKNNLVSHLKFHRNEEKEFERETLKAWLISVLVTVVNIPLNAFNSFAMKILFWLARLCPVNSKKARSLADGEAK